MICPSPITVKDPRVYTAEKQISVPCGKCGACRSNRRADWSFRLKEELRVSDCAHFITLTYTDDNLKFSTNGYATLDKRDLQLFTKRLRKANKKFSSNKLRYYSVGEYGSNTGRPHYHSIMFNLHSGTLADIPTIWSLGGVHVGEVNGASIHYVSKFHVNAKKDELNREQEFATMSRRPGIGANYVDRAKRWHRENKNNHVRNDGYIQRLPRYYKEKLFSEFERYDLSKESQKEAEERYWREYERLKALGIDQTDGNEADKIDAYLHKSQLVDSKKVFDKNQNNDTF